MRKNELQKEFDRLNDKAFDLMAEKPFSTKVSLSHYAYETLKFGNAMLTNSAPEYNMWMGRVIVDKDLKGKEMEFHNA